LKELQNEALDLCLGEWFGHVVNKAREIVLYILKGQIHPTRAHTTHHTPHTLETGCVREKPGLQFCLLIKCSTDSDAKKPYDVGVVYLLQDLDFTQTRDGYSVLFLLHAHLLQRHDPVCAEVARTVYTGRAGQSDREEKKGTITTQSQGK